MIDIKVANRYAKSLLGLATERKIEKEVFADMKLIADTCKQNHDLSVVFRSPIINTDKKNAIIKGLFGGKINEMTMSFLDIITRKRREYFIEQIANEYMAIYNAGKGISIAYVTTAVPIDDKLRQEIKAIVEKKTGNKVELIEQIKKELIGGYILRFGDEQIDASFSRKLQALRKDLQTNAQ